MQICPTIFVQDDKETVPHLLDTARCIECGHCVAICPGEAISHSSFPPGSCSPIQPEQLPDTAQLIELLRSRRSIREFRKKSVDRALIEQIIEGARFAPSSHNSQSTEYIVVQDPAVLRQVVEPAQSRWREPKEIILKNRDLFSISRLNLSTITAFLEKETRGEVGETR